MKNLSLDESYIKYYADLVRGHERVIICKEVPLVTFYESFKIDSQKVIYFGTEESFAEWKRTNGMAA